MKKHISLLLALAMLLGLTACGKGPEPGVTHPTVEVSPCSLRTTVLTQDRLALLPLSDARYQQAFAFHTAEEADGMKVMIFKLENGSWEDLAGGSWNSLRGDSWDAEGARNGDLLLRFDSLSQEASLDTDGLSVTLYPTDRRSQDLEGLNSDTRLLEAITEFDWEELVPVAVQAFSHQDRVISPGLDIWEHPEAYEGQDYEAVYVLALSFRPAADEAPAEPLP